MSTCKDCLYRCMCYKIEHYGRETETDKPCEMFKNKADYVEVVRCKDCKHCEFEKWDEDILCGCLHPSGLNDMSPNGFCSYGERKESEVQGECLSQYH